MKIMYADDSDYGQQILQIIAEIAELQDDRKLYTKNEICSRLRKVKNWAYNLIQKVQDTPATDEFYNPFINVMQWHEALVELEKIGRR